MAEEKQNISIRNYLGNQPEESKIEKKVEEVAEELQVALPKNGEALGIRIVALMCLVGGLSLMAGMITDIVNPEISFQVYFLRGIMGALFIGVAYGLLKRKLWPLWVLMALVAIGFFTNPAAAVVILLLLIYLWSVRNGLEAGDLDVFFESKFLVFKKLITEKLK